jgi:hypothetical protein
MTPTTGVLSGTPTSSGTYNLNVSVRDSGNPQQTQSKMFTLIVNTQQVTGPTAHFTMSAQGQTASDGGTLTLTMQSGGAAPQVTFTSTSAQGSAAITSYVWKSNGTQFCTGSSCTAPFSTPSNTITLTVTDANGKTSPAQATIIVNTQTVTGPTAHFTMSVQGQTANDGGTLTLHDAVGNNTQVTFTSTSIQGSATITGYSWKSNGTQICSGASCTFSYGIPANTNDASCTSLPNGNYALSLTVTDANGKFATANGTVSVSLSGPYITFVTSPVKAAPDTQLQTMYIDGFNFSTEQQGGQIIFTDTISQQHPSTTFPNRVTSSTSTQWIYTLGDNSDVGTWHAQMLDSSGNRSNICPFTVQ